MAKQADLQRLVDSEIGTGDCQEATVCIIKGDECLTASGGQWNGTSVDADTPFLIASTSKLFIAAMVLHLAGNGVIGLDDPLVQYFPGALDNLHVWKGHDRTGQITVRHLLTHRSGLPDYFEGKHHDGTSLAGHLLGGQDLAYGLTDVIHWVRDEMSPGFAPGTGQRALYSDTNFYLLTELVARVRAQTIDEALDELICGPLRLTQTRFYRRETLALPLRMGRRVLEIPEALASMPGDGGAVSTARDLALFAKAFFTGRLFDAKFLAGPGDWRRVFFPWKPALACCASGCRGSCHHSAREWTSWVTPVSPGLLSTTGQSTI